MARRTENSPEAKFGLKLSAAQRKALLEEVPMPQELERAIRATPPSAPIRFTLQQWEDLGDAVADEANSTEDGKLERRLDAILDRIAGLVDRHSGESESPLLRLFEPDLEPMEVDASGQTALDAIPPEALLSLAADLQQAATAAGETATTEIELAKAEANALAAWLNLSEPLAAKLRAAKASRPLALTFVELLELGIALGPEMEVPTGKKDAEHFTSAIFKVVEALEKSFVQLVPPRSPKRKGTKSRSAPPKDTV